MKKWTDKELITTRDKLEAWSLQYIKHSRGTRMWVITALLGAFAISTGVAFLFLDGVTALSLILILLGSITCYSWYHSEKRKKANIAFLAEVKKELAYRERQASKIKTTGITSDRKASKNESSKKIEAPH
ncbi:MAG: hypothetical protein Q8L82_05850 [Nitrosomonas sp.]|nr:hypothetical protein [Nitrosomonas sp.]